MSTMKKPFREQYRVWHIPQIPGAAFHVETDSYASAKEIQTALAAYDLFQLEHNIKPDYSNASGVQIYQHDLTDEELVEMNLEDRWVDVNDAEELNDYLEHIRSTGWVIL